MRTKWKRRVPVDEQWGFWEKGGVGCHVVRAVGGIVRRGYTRTKRDQGPESTLVGTAQVPVSDGAPHNGDAPSGEGWVGGFG